MKSFEREGHCPECGREYVISGLALHPGAETEGATRFRCACGGCVEAFVPGSVNKDKLVVTEKPQAATR